MKFKVLGFWGDENYGPYEIKHGGSIDKYWEEVNKKTGNRYTWNDIAIDKDQILPPLMPIRDLTLEGYSTGNEEYHVVFEEFEENGGYENKEIKTVLAKSEDCSEQNFTGGRELIGFTWRYVTKPGMESDSPKYNLDTEEWEVRTYYTRNKNKIAFHTNIGDDIREIPDVYFDKDIGEIITKSYIGKDYIVDKTIRDDGYIFKGWYDNKSLVGDAVSFANKKMPDNSLIFYAKWEAPKHTVIVHRDFNNNNKKDKIIVDDGNTINKVLEKNIPGGLTEEDFLGWYWLNNDDFQLFDLSLPIKEDIELYPVWKNITFKIKYEPGGGSGEIKDDTKYFLGSLGLIKSADKIEHAENKHFIGWKDEESGKIYYPGRHIKVLKNINLIAQWTSEALEAKLKYSGNGGSLIEGKQGEFEIENNNEHIIEDNMFEKQGYKFISWNTEVNEAGEGIGSEYKPGDIIIVDNNGENELYAIWEKIPSKFESLKTVDRKEARQGEELNYTIEVKNTGNVILENINIIDNLPKGLTYIDNSLKLNGAILEENIENNIINVSVPSIDIEGVSKLTFKVLVANDIEGKVINIGEVINPNDPSQADKPSVEVVIIPKEANSGGNGGSSGGSGGSSGGSGGRKTREKNTDKIEKDKIENKLNRKDHNEYIKGYPDNSVRPEGLITREEVATVFYRLLNEDYREIIKTEEHKFIDVEYDRWSKKYIASLARGEILSGYKDGSFRPSENITRAELATIASRFDKLSYFEGNKFIDIDNHWANKYINSASEKGWVNGYLDKTFRPNKFITRAEFIELVNNVLNRKVSRENILENSRKFNDLDSEKWYYEAIKEATNSHYYERLDGELEKWTEIYYPKLDM